METSDCVKVDCDNICRGCLSKDRQLTCLQTDLDLLFALLGYADVCSTIYESPILCWECLAQLNNVKKFQRKVREAQNILKTYNSNLQFISSLSTLSTVKSESTSHTVDEESCLENQLQSENLIQINTAGAFTPSKPEELVTKPELDELEYPVKEEHDYDSFEPDWTLQNLEYSDGDMKPDIKLENVKKKRYNRIVGNAQYRRAQYNKRLKVIKGPDLSHGIEKLIKVDILSAEEMEKFLEEYNKSGGYKLKRKCKYCSKAFAKSEDLHRHRLIHHCDEIDPQKCEECDTSCASLSRLRTHWDVHNVVFACSVCGEKYRTAKRAESHVTGHSNFFLCTDCDVTLLSRAHVRRHYEMYHSYALCEYCGKQYKTKTAIANHIRNNHMPAKCSLCGREFCNGMKLKRHHSSAHGYQIMTSGDLAYCVECNKQFKGRKQYLAHVTGSLKHSPDKRVSIPCPECGKPFSRRSYLNNHYKLFHLKKSNHYCPDCEKYFANADGLRKHRRSVHDKIPKEKNKICEICGRGFHTNRILINHRRTHTGERPFQCTLCPHAFAQRVALDAHTRSQHKAAANITPTITRIQNQPPGNTLSLTTNTQQPVLAVALPQII